MLTAKIDLLMKRLDDQASEKKEVMLVNDSRMTCEECGDVGHMGRNCPTLLEDANYINNNNYRPQNQWNQHNSKAGGLTTKVTIQAMLTEYGRQSTKGYAQGSNLQ